MDFTCAFFDEIEQLKLQGQYVEAGQRLQDAADKNPNECNIFLHWGRMAREVGLMAQASLCYDRCKAIVAEQPVDALRHALLDMGTVLTNHYQVGTSAQSASLACSIFEKYMRQRSVEDYDSVAVDLLISYYGLRFRLRLSHDERYVTEPRLGSSFFWNLYRSLMRQNRFVEALNVAICCRADCDENSDALMEDLLQDMLSYSSIPDSIRAKCLDWRSTHIKNTTPGDEWVSMAQEAVRLYQLVGNVPFANEVRLEIMLRDETKIDVEEVSRELIEFSDAAERHGFLFGAIKALNTVERLHYEKNLDMSPSTWAHTVPQLQRLRQMCQNEWLDVYHLSPHLNRWLLRGDSDAQLLLHYEELLQRAKNMNLTSITIGSAKHLSDIYRKLGQDDRAKACLEDLPRGLPGYILRMHQLDPFYQGLKTATSISDQDAAFEQLCQKVEEAETYIPSNTWGSMRNIEVRWFINLQSLYEDLGRRNSNFASIRFIRKCSEAVRNFGKYLSEENAASSLHDAIYHEAVNHMSMSRRIIQENGSIMTDAARKEIDTAIGLLIEDVESDYMKQDPSRRASNYAMLGECYLRRWNYDASSTGDLSKFHLADKCFGLEAELYRSRGYFQGVFLALQGSIQLWESAVARAIQMDEVQPGEKLLQLCHEAEELATARRADRSALKSSQALIAKQISKDYQDTVKVSEVAINYLTSAGDAKRLWAWVQGSKSTSVSDMLALGIKIPAELNAAIERQEDLGKMIREEQSLLQKLNQSKGIDFDLRCELKALQDKMRRIPTLRKVLAFREGRPTTLESLQNVSKRLRRLQGDPSRRTVFVDWFIRRGGEIYCLVVTDDESSIHLTSTETSLSDIKKWRETYFKHAEDDDDHNLTLSGEAALGDLSKLVQLAVQFSDESDLLVFCPASILHGLPLHAALIDDEKGICKSLIERNPIIYTSSMTTYEYCVSRQLDAMTQVEAAAHNSLIAVFESLESGSFDEFGKVQREQIYTSVQALAKKLPASSAILGSEASVERVAKALNADLVSFFGHCSFEPSDYLDQGLVLAPKVHDMGDAAKAGEEAETTTGSGLFTASQMFDINIKASNIMLMACGSAMQSHVNRDEPLGMITALLCVGASSVTGTLWKTRVPTALAFSNAFHVALSRERNRNNSSILDLARTVQTAVCRLKQRPDTKSPLQWASFVLNGSWFMKRSGLSSG